jgi:2-oxoacid:acceptor oxidoreductase gamma subunit (pyruvate/2-ketoisovalerate family)
MKEIRMHGRGGQGTVVAAEILATAFLADGKYATSIPSFGQERRGAPVAAFVRLDTKPIRERSRIYHPDIVVILDKILARSPTCYSGLKKCGTIILNHNGKELSLPNLENLESLATVDATSISLQELGVPITNSCMLGAFARVTDIVQLDTLSSALEEFLEKDLLNKNKRCLQRGFEEVKIKRG